MIKTDISHSISIFLELFRKGLTLVDNDYFGLHWWNESMLNEHLSQDETEDRKVLTDYLDRYGERVFCYELYHQVRTLMDCHTKICPETFKELRLQSELKKEHIDEIVAKYFSVKDLDSEYIPDFLLHTPKNFDRQGLIIEVKTNPKLTFSGMKDDLLKIQQFISSYSFDSGIFLTINTNPKKISNIINEKDSKDWLRQNITTPSKITIMCKKKNDVELLELTIEQILS